MGLDAILRLKQSLLFNNLQEKEKNTNNILSSKIIEVVSDISSLLERVPENMPEYTLHDPNHSAKVVENMGKIIPSETLGKLNTIELSLLILSGYLHDIGMTCSKEEKEEIIKNSQDFDILFKSDVEKYKRFLYYKEIGDHRSATFVQDQVFTEYLRRNHVHRSADYMKNNLATGNLELSYQGIPFLKPLIAICDGHGASVAALKHDPNKWPRHTLIGENIINVQYLSLVLRLGDILDLDPERTPKVIYEYVNPQDPISILEWKKHRSIIGHSISSTKILFEADCSSPEVERALKEFMGWIEFERKSTIELLESYNDDIAREYKLSLSDSIAIDRIKSDGSYIYNDLKFEINYQRVIELLMGHKLYKSTTIALRELLQNSIDAIKIRLAIYEKKNEKFQPQITIQFDASSLIITDNGVGMDEEVFKKYFLQVGSSFSSSPIFYSQFPETDVTSEFGIGILSTFMVANSIVVESRKEPDNPLQPPNPILFEIPTAYSYTIQKNSLKIEVGTKITLKLKSDNPFEKGSSKKILEEFIPTPPFPIKVKDYEMEYDYTGLEKKQIDQITLETILSATSPHPYVINGFEPSDTDTFFKLFDIEFLSSDTDPILSHIQGNVSIINSEIMNWTSMIRGSITQRFFTIGKGSKNSIYNHFFYLDAIDGLFPNWTSFHCELNLNKSACLTLTPDRLDIIVDEKYKKLKYLIEKTTIKSFEQLFNHIVSKYGEEGLDKYLYFLIATGFIGVDIRFDNRYLSDESLAFLKEYIRLPVLEPSGKIVRIKVKEILKCETIGIIDYDWKDEYIDMILEVVKEQKITLIMISKINSYSDYLPHSIERIICALIGYKSILYGVHTIITSFLPFLSIKLIRVNNALKILEEYNDLHNIVENTANEDRNIIFTIRQSYDSTPYFNITHPILNNLVDEKLAYKNKQAIKLKNDLYNFISQELTNSLDRILKSHMGSDVIEHMTIHRRNYFKLTRDIFLKDPVLLPNLIKIFTNFWEDCQKSDLINREIEMPTITERDFMSYWSREHTVDN